MGDDNIDLISDFDGVVLSLFIPLLGGDRELELNDDWMTLHCGLRSFEQVFS